MKKNKFSITIIVVFLAMMILPLMNTQLTGGDHSATEKRYLAPLPDVLIDGGLNPDLLDEFKNWLSDHIGFREKMVRLVSVLKLRIFNQSPSDQVHIGKDGWYYYIPNDNLEIATGEYHLSQEILDQILYSHLYTQKKLQEDGIEYVIILPCSKASIYPEYIRKQNSMYRDTPVDIVADYLEQNSDLKIIRLKEVLIDAKETTQVYFKTDTHWTQAGAYIAYQKIINDLCHWDLCATKPIEVSFEESEYLGEFGAMMGSSSILDVEPTLNAVFTANTESYINEECSNGLWEFLNDSGINKPCYYYRNTKLSNHKSVLMLGDSMFGSWNATSLLAENFSEFTYIWDTVMYENVIDYIKPDIVLYEVTERYLTEVPNRLASYLRTPLGDYRAEFMDCHFENNDLIVEVKNTSAVSWKYGDMVRCGIYQNGNYTSIRADLYPNVIVEPGESTVFKFENIKDKLNTTAEITMVQEGVLYFPERLKIFS